MSHDWNITFSTIWAAWLFWPLWKDWGCYRPAGLCLSERFPSSCLRCLCQKVTFCQKLMSSVSVCFVCVMSLFILVSRLQWTGFTKQVAGVATVESFLPARLQLLSSFTCRSSSSLTAGCMALLSEAESRNRRTTNHSRAGRRGRSNVCLHERSGVYTDMSTFWWNGSNLLNL